MLVAMLAACAGGDGVEVAVPFSLRVHGAPLECGATFPGVGAPERDIEPLDGRFFVHDVALVDAGGAAYPLTLTPDGVWQDDRVALLDFEDDTGACDTGSPDTNDLVRGTADLDVSEAVGVRFTLGVPAERNHLDAATADAPLDVSGMWWSWASGYRYARLDVRTAENPLFHLHVGGTACTLDDGVYGCTYDNLSTVDLPWTAGDVVALDLGTLLEANDVEAPYDGEIDFVSGCMSSESDPECPPIFERLGISWDGAQGAATAFSTVAP